MIIGRNRPGGPATQAIEGSNNVTTFSDAELQELIQAYLDGGGNIANLRFDNKGEAHAIHVYAVTGEIYSPEAEAVFENMPTEPTDPQKQAIAAFVDDLVAADIWSKIDHFNFMGSGLSWPENNALTDWIAGRTAIKNGTPTLGLDGYDFNGTTDYLDSNFNPSTDGTAYQLNDAIMGLYASETIGDGNYFGVIASGAVAQLSLQQANDLLNNSLNDGGGTNVALVNKGNNLLAIVERDSASARNVHQNGGAGVNSSGPSSIVPPDNVFIAARKNTVAQNFTNCKITNFLAGGSLTDPQHVTLYNSLIQLLIDFDVFAGPVLARFPSLTAAEQTAVRNFVNTEVKNGGNWFLYDEFFCFAFTNSADCLTGFKSKTATNNGATFDGTGAVFAGAEYIRTNFAPDPDGVNYKQNDALYGFYVKQNNTNQTAFAVTLNGSLACKIDQVTDARLQYRINNSGQTQYTEQTAFANDTLYAVKADATVIRLLIDGVESGGRNNDTTLLPTQVFDIGARADNPTPSPFNGTISTFMIGAAIGFDHSGHNVAVRQLLTELGAI